MILKMLFKGKKWQNVAASNVGAETPQQEAISLR